MFKNSLNDCSAYGAFRMACLFNSIFPEDNPHGINRKDLFSASGGLLMLTSVGLNLNKNFLKNSTGDTDALKALAYIDAFIIMYAGEVIRLRKEGMADINNIASTATTASYDKIKSILLPMLLDTLQDVLPESKFGNSAAVIRDIVNNGVRSVLDTVMQNNNYDSHDRDMAAAMVVSLFGDLDPLQVGMAACRLRELQIRGLNMLEVKASETLLKILKEELPKDVVKKIASPDQFTAYLTGQIMQALLEIIDKEFSIPDARIRKFVEMHLYSTFAANYGAITVTLSAKVLRKLLDLIGMSAKNCMNEATKRIWPEGIPGNMADLVGNITDSVCVYNEDGTLGMSAEDCTQCLLVRGNTINIDDLGASGGLKEVLKAATNLKLNNISGCLGDGDFDFIIENKHVVDVTNQRAVVNMFKHLTKIFAEENASEGLERMAGIKNEEAPSENGGASTKTDKADQKPGKRLFN